MRRKAPLCARACRSGRLLQSAALLRGRRAARGHPARQAGGAAGTLDIDDHLAEAHTALAFATWIYDLDWRAAEKGMRRAVDLNGAAVAHNTYGIYLTACGRGEHAITEMQRAQELEPVSLIIKMLHKNRRVPLSVNDNMPDGKKTPEHRSRRKALRKEVAGMAAAALQCAA